MLTDHWYSLVASGRLRSRPVAATAGERDLVVFRDDRARARVLLDRCSHRGVPLSAGVVAGSTIACRYHGWRYDGEGACVAVPSLRDGNAPPRRAEVPSFECVEQDGWVWVWIPGALEAPSGPPPRICSFEDYAWRQGSVQMACSFRAGIENNLDWCHPAFAHPWTHPQWYAAKLRGLSDVSYEVRVSPDGLVMFAPATTAPDDPLPPRPVVLVTFTLPNRIIVEFWRPVHSLIVMHFVPTGPARCRLDWMSATALPLARRGRAQYLQLKVTRV
ncbi:MAG: Rieske 2Fe-2S domain-containing protein [Acidimicrobiales bacterium]